MKKTLATVETRPTIKLCGSIIQIVGVLSIIVGLIAVFIYSMETWYILPGFGLYIAGMILGTEAEIAIENKQSNKFLSP